MTIVLENNIKLPAKVFALSAVEHDIELNSFVASMDNFSEQAAPHTAPERLYAWREEALDEYFRLMKESGKIKHVEKELFSGSDFGDDEDGPSDSNKQITNKEKDHES